jgi:hypothetical protein
MIYEFHAAEAAAGQGMFGGCIERAVGVENAARINWWANPETVKGYSTWQVQQLRRIVRLLRRTGDYQLKNRADELDELTVHILRERGAMCFNGAPDNSPGS